MNTKPILMPKEIATVIEHQSKRARAFESDYVDGAHDLYVLLTHKGLLKTPHPEEEEQKTLVTDEKILHIAQWVIDYRYPKSENDKISDFELYSQLVDRIKEYAQSQVQQAERRIEALEAVTDLMKVPEDEDGLEKFHEALEKYNALKK